MNVIQNNFINKSYQRGRDHDLQVDEETSREVRPNYRQDKESTTAKMNEENHKKHSIINGTLQLKVSTGSLYY